MGLPRPSEPDERGRREGDARRAGVQPRRAAAVGDDREPRPLLLARPGDAPPAHRHGLAGEALRADAQRPADTLRVLGDDRGEPRLSRQRLRLEEHPPGTHHRLVRASPRPGDGRAGRQLHGRRRPRLRRPGRQRPREVHEARQQHDHPLPRARQRRPARRPDPGAGVPGEDGGADRPAATRVTDVAPRHRPPGRDRVPGRDLEGAGGPLEGNLEVELRRDRVRDDRGRRRRRPDQADRDDRG